MITFILGFILFIFTQVLREFVFRKGAEAKSLKLGQYDKGTTIINAIYLGSFTFVPIILVYYNFGFSEKLRYLNGIGIFVMILGMFIHLLAIKTLGEKYTRTLTITKKHTIMQKGIYGIIRHPGYMGSILVGLGFGMASSNWLFLSITIVFLIGAYAYRIKSEEAMLIKQFGDEYDKYKQNSWALIPYVL